MANQKIIRAWKDPAYRNSLTEAERAGMPFNPAGSIELSDADLGKAGAGIVLPTRYNFCTFYCTLLHNCITDALTCTCQIK